MSLTCRRISGETPTVRRSRAGSVSAIRIAASERGVRNDAREAARRVATLSISRFPLPALRALDGTEDPPNELIARHLFCFGLVRRQHAVPQYVGRNRLHVIGRHEGSPAQE